MIAEAGLPPLRDVVRQGHLEGRDQATLPPHSFDPVGYIVQQHLARADRPVAGYERWSAQIPAVFHEFVLEDAVPATLRIDKDSYCLATLKHFASLVPLAQAARKPMFDLRRADGIGGGQIQAVAKCREEFEGLARVLAERLGLAALVSTTS
jgi:hypothetical protein